METIATGAKGTATFENAVQYGSLPSESSIQYEGIFYDYCWETADPKDKSFKANFVYAVSKDPFNGNHEYYVGVGMSGCLDGDGLYKNGGRPSLDLVIVLDISGSMDSPFSWNEQRDISKLEIAKNSIFSLMGRLTDKDKFGLIIFDDKAETIQELQNWKNVDQGKLKEQIKGLKTRGGTVLEVGMKKASSLFTNESKNRGRILFLTDADTTPKDGIALESVTKECAQKGIYTTFIGMGVDFQTDIIDKLGKIRGCNYFSVKSNKDFKKQMDEEFDYMVTLSNFNVAIDIKSSNKAWEVERVFGSPGDEHPKAGRLLFIDSSFPSPKSGQENMTKGGYILVKMRKVNEETAPLQFEVSYEDRNGKKHVDHDELVFPKMKKSTDEFYGNQSIRKAVLLVRYVNFIKWFLRDTQARVKNPSISLESGIKIPPLSVEKEHSYSVTVTSRMDERYQEMFKKFIEYYEKEMEAIDDSALEKQHKMMNTIVDNDKEIDKRQDKGSGGGRGSHIGYFEM